MTRPVHVCWHAWRYYSDGNDDHNQEYTDDDAAADGWSVYVRTEPDEGGEFTILDDVDVPTFEDARLLAQMQGFKFGTRDIRRF